ncbi:hypothetical protein EUX98_g3864 [Antrodiella citrinella]|uniref:CUE domain-containing protein n=1 Tax=Antrodiella citrinella TaxID=2447956 RepID=A0A4S4MVG0_9APHY|nr:hypothetical protein EUX98_g3864 [Antrodiella citrinella]
MSFENAPVTKGLMMGIALISVTAGIFDVKHYLHLQLVPHISKYHQYWRLFTHHFACGNSSDLFLTELLLYNVAVHIERTFGSLKFASFLSLSVVVNSLLQFIAMLALRPLPYFGTNFNRIHAGPTALLFSVVYQYLRIIPYAYQFKVFGVSFNDKVWTYALASQFAVSYFPATLLPVLSGLLSGFIYRSEILPLKGWRISHKIVRMAQEWIGPLLGEERPIRRTNRVLPQSRVRRDVLEGNDEIVTTARPSDAGVSIRDNQDTPSTVTPSETPTPEEEPRAAAGGMVRQWMSELTGSARPTAAGGGTVRVPSDSEINMLTGMFPDIARDVILGVLQRSPNLEAAAETLLSSQTSS